MLLMNSFNKTKASHAGTLLYIAVDEQLQ